MKLTQGLRALMHSTVSRRATSAALPPIRVIKKDIVTSECGARGAFGRRIIAHTQEGPFYRQTGWAKDGKPILKEYYRHHYLHATKGWREFVNGMPAAEQPKRHVTYAKKPRKPSKVYPYNSVKRGWPAAGVTA